MTRNVVAVGGYEYIITNSANNALVCPPPSHPTSGGLKRMRAVLEWTCACRVPFPHVHVHERAHNML